MSFENYQLITEEEKKSVLLEILEKLDKLFTENNITYFLAYGTLLGAVRHKGFIPWDDDIDLLLPRESFIRFIHICEEQKDKLREMNLEIVEYGVNKKDYYKRFKIADTRTVMEEFGEERSAVFIDIFPLDCFPEMSVERLKKMRRKILVVDNLCSLCYAGYVQASGIKKIIYSLLLFVHKIIGLERMVRFYENKLLSLTKYREDGFVCDSEAGVGKDNFPKSKGWKNTVRVPFEDKMCCIPEEYDSILKMWYGDYMKLPPEDQRHSHEYYKMYWR